MEVNTRQILLEDPMSDCRSFGRNFHPSSQSRKISIGVMVDSLAKKKPGTTKEDEHKGPNTERTKPSTGISTEGKSKVEAKGKQSEDTEHAKSPWITPRSFRRKSLATETTQEGTTNSRQKRLNAVKNVPVTYSVKFFPNQTLNAQEVGSNQNKLNSPTCNRNGVEDHNSQTVEEFNFASARKVLELDKVVVEEKTNKTQNAQTETLKMKLQQLLGTVSSPRSPESSSQSQEVNANNLKPEMTADPMGDRVVKPRQNSDTIETDSDNPDKTIKRPVTRSLTRKRASAKVKPDKTRVGSISRKKHGESIISFGEGRRTKIDGAINSGSSLFWKKKSQKKSSKIDPRKICFHEEDSADGIQQTTYRSEISLPKKKTSLNGDKIESFPSFFSQKRNEKFEKVQEKESFHPPATNETSQQFNIANPTSPEKGDKQEDFGNISLRNVEDTQYDFQSPTFGVRTPTSNACLSPTPKTVEIEQCDFSPITSDRGFTIGNVRSFRTFQTSSPICNQSNAQPQSPVDAQKHIDSLLKNTTPIKEKIDAVNEHYESSSEESGPESFEESFKAQSPVDAQKLIDSSLKNTMPSKENIDAVNEHSESSSEESGSERFEESLPIVKKYDCHRENIISLETGITEKPKFVHRPIKRFRNHEDVTLNDFSPTLPSPKVGAGIGESYWFQETSEHDQDDELTRAVTLFVLALETFKRKIDSAAKRKSAEILMSISNDIKPLLLDAESQIDSDVGKLTTLAKTKRKRLETRFQEQQEQLKLILQKFKEDIHQHLLDCRSTVEGMEAHQIELKGIMKKQKASHKKLLMHVEEAIEVQLSNAERRITAVNESAKEKMLQLKHVIAECLKDCIY